MAAGRTTEVKTAAVTKTSAAATVTAPAGTFNEEDVGRAISGTGVPAATTILSVQSDTAATMSANASASNSATVTFAAVTGESYGFRGWSPETDTESEAYTVAANIAGTPVPPDRILNTTTRVEQRTRS